MGCPHCLRFGVAGMRLEHKVLGLGFRFLALEEETEEEEPNLEKR